MTFETFARDVEAALIKRGVSEGEAFNAISNYGAVISERYKSGGYSAARVAEEIDLHRSGFDDAAERVRDEVIGGRQISRLPDTFGFAAPRVPSAHRSPAKHTSKPPTYAAAREALFAYLRAEGWKLDTSLKIPHATSPDNRTRVWFKAQAVYVDRNNGGYGVGRFDFKSARSTWLDIRALSPAQFAKDVQV